MKESTSVPTHVFDPRLSASALRNFGFRSTALAVASLVDNSLDAEADNIAIITLSKVFTGTRGRRSYLADKIAVLDDGDGMDLNTLSRCLSLGWTSRSGSFNGIGKFGYGLLGSSLSQCRRVDVYSWRSGRCYHTAFDIDDTDLLDGGTLPIIRNSEIPNVYQTFFEAFIRGSGTLVIWSKLDKIDFTKSRTLLNRIEGDLCRIYRYFLDKDDAYGRRRNILICDVDLNNHILKATTQLKANDPLYLLEPSNVPGSEGKATNELFEEPYSLNIEYAPGKSSEVEIRLSIALPSTQLGEPGDLDRGHTEIGNRYLKNTGISFVSAAREIDFGAFGFLKNSNDTRNRWWGAEVRFKPELDELFGVTNNKQQIRGFERLDMIRDKEFVDSLQSIAKDEDNAGCYRARLHLALNKHLDTKIGNMMSIIRTRKLRSRNRDRQMQRTDMVVDRVNRDVSDDKTITSSTRETCKKINSQKFEERYKLILESREDLSR